MLAFFAPLTDQVYCRRLLLAPPPLEIVNSSCAEEPIEPAIVSEAAHTHEDFVTSGVDCLCVRPFALLAAS